MKNNAKQFLNNSKAVQKTSFLLPNIVKNKSSRPPKSASILPKILISGIINQPFELKIIRKSKPFKAENNALILPKQLTVKKSRIRLFERQNCQNMGVNLAKKVVFWGYFRSTSSILACWQC